MHRLSGPRSATRSALALSSLAASALVLSGCSSMVSSSATGSFAPTASSSGTVTGHVHGGNQPVAGATVSLYFAGTNGLYPTGGATLIAQTTSASDGFGSFSFVLDPTSTSGGNNGSSNHFHCASSSDTTYVFVVARGGSTVGNNSTPNPDAAFIAPMANCNAITSSTFVNMSEVTTVGTIAAIHQFMNSSNASTTPIENSITSDAIFAANNALSNAFNLVANMVNPATGLANSAFTRTGGFNGAQGVTITITPETAKINQLANIISSCINYAPTNGSRNSNCTSIYNAATPANGTAPTDLLTALFDIFSNTNPSSTSVTTLNNLAGTGPYTPTLTTQPTDWSIGINYASSGTCNGVTNASFYSSPGSISVDQYGDIQVANNNSTLGTLSELSPTGFPTACTPLTPVNGTFTPTFLNASSTIFIPNNSAVYTYSGSPNSTDLYRYSDVAPNSGSVTSLVATEPVLALASDKNGNIFYSTTGGNLFEIPVGTTTSTKINTSTTLGNMTSLAIDERSRIWAASSTNAVNYFIPTFDGSGNVTAYSGGAGLVTSSSAKSIMVSRSGAQTVVYATDPTTNTTTAFTVTNSGTTATSAGITSVSGQLLNTAAAGASNPGSLVLDGNLNLWLASTSTAAIAGLSPSGNPVTPSTGVVKAASAPGNGASAIAVDPAGNLWTASGPNSITEIVGEAAPTFMPYSSALATGRFQTIP